MLTAIECIQASRNERQEGLVLPKMYHPSPEPGEPPKIPVSALPYF